MDSGYKIKKIGFYPKCLRPFLRNLCAVDDFDITCRRSFSALPLNPRHYSAAMFEERSKWTPDAERRHFLGQLYAWPLQLFQSCRLLPTLKYILCRNRPVGQRLFALKYLWKDFNSWGYLWLEQRVVYDKNFLSTHTLRPSPSPQYPCPSPPPPRGICVASMGWPKVWTSISVSANFCSK